MESFLGVNLPSAAVELFLTALWEGLVFWSDEAYQG